MLNEKKIFKAISSLRSNKIIILPTDTIYGFSATITQENAYKINSLKGAHAAKPLIAIFDNLNQIEKYGSMNPETKELLLASEPTTVIIPALSGNYSIGVRLAKREDIKKIIQAVGPLWSTSVNYHQAPTITDPENIEKNFPEIEIFIDENQQKNKPSRIFDQINNCWIRK